MSASTAYAAWRGADAEPLGCELSVIVPTRNEAASVPLLLECLREALDGLDAEVIFVDDSDDETPRVIAARATESAPPLRLLHRLPAQRLGGLGGAVKAGFAVASGEFLLVMDADLQHPPSLAPVMLRHARDERADLVIGSRFTVSGSVGQFGALRTAVSRASSLLARLCFPRRLAHVTDPMSGLFLVRRDSLDPAALRPNGFKILLEVVARSTPARVVEVPYVFGERVADESKASLSEGFRFLRHLLRLRIETLTVVHRTSGWRTPRPAASSAAPGSAPRP